MHTNRLQLQEKQQLWCRDATFISVTALPIYHLPPWLQAAMMASSSAAAEALGLAVGVVGQVAWHLHPTQSQRLSPWTQIPAQTPRARREALAPRAWIRSQNLAWSQAWIRAQAPGAYQPRAPAWARALAQVCTLVRARERVSMCWGVIHVGANKLALPLDVRSVASR